VGVKFIDLKIRQYVYLSDPNNQAAKESIKLNLSCKRASIH